MQKKILDLFLKDSIQEDGVPKNIATALPKILGGKFKNSEAKIKVLSPRIKSLVSLNARLCKNSEMRKKKKSMQLTEKN